VKTKIKNLGKKKCINLLLSSKTQRYTSSLLKSLHLPFTSHSSPPLPLLLFHLPQKHCLMNIKGTVCRNQDGHFINIGLEIIISEEVLVIACLEGDSMFYYQAFSSSCYS